MPKQQLAAILLSCLAFQVLADTPAKVLVPFGETAIWAANLDEVKQCAQGKCEEESQMGVQQAMNYALNNARVAMKYVEDKKLKKQYFETIDTLIVKVAEMSDIEAGTEEWKKMFNQAIKSFLQFFNDEKFIKLMKETKVVMDVPSDDIGLTFRSQSLDIPLYKKEDIKKGLSELKLKMNDGVEIPKIGFGTWQMEGKECKEAVLAALKFGYRHIDTAQSYENEQDVGEAIQEAIKQGIIKSREDVFLVTKLSEPKQFTERRATKAALQQMKVMQTDYLDVYMLHGPEEDMKTNRQAWKGMVKLQKEDKINALGVSNFETAEDLKALARNAGVKPNYIQNKFSIYSPGGQNPDQDSMLSIAEQRGMAFVGYSVINPWPYVVPPMKDPHVVAIAERYKKTPAQILYRWALQLNVVVIPKSKNAERIAENAGVLEFALGEIDMRLLNGLAVLYQSTTEQHPAFVKDVYELFKHDADGSQIRDEL